VQALQLTLPPPPAPAGTYNRVVLLGDLLYVSGAWRGDTRRVSFWRVCLERERDGQHLTESVVGVRSTSVQGGRAAAQGQGGRRGEQRHRRGGWDGGGTGGGAHHVGRATSRAGLAGCRASCGGGACVPPLATPLCVRCSVCRPPVSRPCVTCGVRQVTAYVNCATDFEQHPQVCERERAGSVCVCVCGGGTLSERHD